MLRKIQSVTRFLLRKQTRERELDRELRYHLERQTEENIRLGMRPQHARRAALRDIGAIEQIKEECRDARLGRAVETTLQDIRYGARVLLKNAGFTSVAIVTLALGIGVNTAIFSVVYGVLLRPLPYRQGGQLVVLHQVVSRAHLDDVPFSVKEIRDYRDQNHTLQGVVEHHTMFFLLLGKDWAERVQTAVVSANFFDVLGVKPLLGRTFVASDDTPKSDAVLIMSYKYWRNRFGGDPNIVGKVFQMNNRPNTVIGVLPPIPQYPQESDVYMPTSQCPTRSSPQFIANRNARMMTAFARLRPGVSLEKAQADLSTLAAEIEKSYPDIYKGYGYGLAAAPLRDDLTRRARNTFLVLLGASGFVLLIACANVANLLLARLLKIERELAVRAALGATKLRLMRQLLTESVLLSLAGGVLGLVAAPSAVALLVKFAEHFTTRAAEVKIDAPILLFALSVSLLTGILFGLAPAWTSNTQISDTLRQGFTRITSTRARQRFRAALVIAQVAVSFMLLIGAGLMVGSLIKLQQVNPGFDPDHLLTMRVSLNFSQYRDNDQQIVVAHKILHNVSAVGAIQSAALASSFPFNPARIAQGPQSIQFQIEGRMVPKGQVEPLVDVITISPEYFQTLRQPVFRGRTFTEHDGPKAPNVAIINETMARHRWPKEDPIGKRISFDEGKTWAKIVGIVGDTTEYGLGGPVADEAYFPNDQNGFSGDLIVRTAVDPMSVSPLIREAIRKVDAHLAIDRVNTIASFEHDSIASPRITTILLGLFAALALLISAGGIAAVMALAVSQRTHELGIRMALGASRNYILQMVIGQGLRLAFAGTVLGILGALALTRLLASLLYATSPTDVSTFIAISILFLVIAAVACWVPARQVTAIDPVNALRQE